MWSELLCHFEYEALGKLHTLVFSQKEPLFITLQIFTDFRNSLTAGLRRCFSSPTVTDVVRFRLVGSLLYFSPPNFGQSDLGCLVFIFRTKLTWLRLIPEYWFVTHARCSGALTCWMITNSPEISRHVWQAVASESQARYGSMCHWCSPWDQQVSFIPTWTSLCHHQ